MKVFAPLNSEARGGFMRKDSRGQTLVEYALILGVIVIMAIAAMVLLRNQISAFFTNLANVLAGYSS